MNEQILLKLEPQEERRFWDRVQITRSGRAHQPGKPPSGKAR